MNVNAMRTIDKWVGVPLCSLASLLSRVRNMFSPKKVPNTKRTLFIELSEMGSAVIVDPGHAQTAKGNRSRVLLCHI